jgi:hypothetical protein
MNNSVKLVDTLGAKVYIGNLEGELSLVPENNPPGASRRIRRYANQK